MNCEASYQSQKMTCISETRLKKTQEITTNIKLENYNIEYVPTESANGGVLLYIIKTINYKLRPG